MFQGDARLPHIAKKIQAQISKTALGATASVPFEYHDNLLTWLTTNTLPLVGLEQSGGSVMISDYTPRDEFVLVLGEEVEGINHDLLSACEDIVEIPMQGAKESFNVSVAAGIALYALTI